MEFWRRRSGIHPVEFKAHMRCVRFWQHRHKAERHQAERHEAERHEAERHEAGRKLERPLCKAFFLKRSTGRSLRE